MAPSSAGRPPTDYSRPASSSSEIPLTKEDIVDTEGSMGSLVKDAATHVSTLVRSEIELAKIELKASIKQALKGSVFFAAAAAIALFSLWFFWLAIGEILSIWLPRWASFSIVFGAMLLGAVLLVIVGIKKMKKIKKPEKTISEAQQTAQSLKKASSRN